MGEKKECPKCGAELNIRRAQSIDYVMASCSECDFFQEAGGGHPEE